MFLILLFLRFVGLQPLLEPAQGRSREPPVRQVLRPEGAGLRTNGSTVRSLEAEQILENPDSRKAKCFK